MQIIKPLPKTIFDPKKLKNILNELNAQIKFNEINEQAYDGSKFHWYEIDEVSHIDVNRKNPLLIKDCFKK
jgi:hypothetical protein